MSTDVRQLVEEYGALLRDRLRGADEIVLLHAYELGRRSLEAGAGAVDLVAAHTRAVAEAVRRVATAEEAAEVAAMAGEILAESLGPAEMTLRGFREANAGLQELNASLESQVAERTRDLQESLARLRKTDEERRLLLARIVSTQEEERRRIAGDIHDDSIQVMTAAVIRIELLLQRVDDPELAEMAAGLRETVRLAVERLRRLMFELRPPALDRQGLVPALRNYLEELEAAEPTLALSLEQHLPTEPRVEMRVILYRIAQEALMNVRKHAHASRADLLVEERSGGVAVRVRDDGVGFETSEDPTSPHGHLGLTSMHERATMAGGWCRVESVPGEGTTVEFWVPG